MDNRTVSIEVNIDHPDCDDRIQAAVQIPANEFGPDVIRHMTESLYGVIKERALRSSSAIVLPKKLRLVQ